MRETLGLIATMRRARLLAPMRPDRYLRIAAAMRREGMGMTSGFAAAAQRCPDRPGLVDERGSLTWRQLDERCDALAAALQALQSGAPAVIGIMCRNHRGFVEALVAADRIGADIVLLNTSFAGPALADVITREGVNAVIYDEEFTATVDRALAGRPDAIRIVAWTDTEHQHTVDKLIASKAGARPIRTGRKGKMILLTSGTTGTPKGAKQSGGNAGIGTLKAILDRTPWRAEEPVVIVAPMFHAWGFSQLLLAASFACPVITRRKFDPEATLDLIDRHRATGLVVVPVMFDRIMDLPAEVRRRYECRSLRFAAASGSRMRPDVVVAFMDEFGDVIYNNYNATEAGMIATATPADLRAAPD
ncbi:AMP-dependent synthetase, partial [Mycobacterium avium subsp. paratuberculosis 11-1786]